MTLERSLTGALVAAALVLSGCGHIHDEHGHAHGDKDGHHA